jgi:hypothetical protein
MKTTTMSSQHRRSQHLPRGVDELEERRVQPPRLPRQKGNNNNQIQNFPTTTRKCQIPKTTRISRVRNLRRRREVELLLPLPPRRERREVVAARRLRRKQRVERFQKVSSSTTLRIPTKKRRLLSQLELKEHLPAFREAEAARAVPKF